MKVLECPHCLTKVVFDTNGICPACAKDKNILPTKSRDLILQEKLMKEVKDQILYFEKHGPKLIGTGILLIVVSLGLSVLFSLNGTTAFFFSGLALLGLGTTAKGFVEIRNAKELKYKHREYQ
jgi:hypothetical protein